MSIGPITAAVMVFLAVVSTTTAHSIVQHQVTVSQPHCTDPFDCIAPTSPRGLHQPRHDICTCRPASVLSAGRCHAKAVDDSLRASQLFINYGILSTLSVRDEFGLKLTSSSPANPNRFQQCYYTGNSDCTGDANASTCATFVSAYSGATCSNGCIVYNAPSGSCDGFHIGCVGASGASIDISCTTRMALSSPRRELNRES